MQPPLKLGAWHAFVVKHGRFPRIGDKVAPWKYRGWLLGYVVLIHESCRNVPDRWGYYLRTVAAGQLLDEPIPQIHFGEPDKRMDSFLTEWARCIGWDQGGWSDFRTLLDWLQWGLGLTKDEPRLSAKQNEKLYRTVNLGPMLAQPYDYLGAFVSMRKAPGWNPTAFYPTPHQVVELMVQMTMHDNIAASRADGRDPRTYSVCDPCVGSGRMLLHASNFSLNLFGQDIDPLAVAMCKINGALYAPWISYPMPESILNAPQERNAE